MRALLCRQLGSLDNLEYGEAAAPTLGSGDVKIAVHASGVNFPDILMVEGKYQVKPQLPFIPGLEVAGEVVECATGVSHVKPGDRVLGFARYGGGHAEQVVLPANIVTPIPDSMDYSHAASLPVAYGTAHFALDYRGALKSGETLLVLGAGGGVGLAAVHIGKLMGARVIAAASSVDKLAAAAEHGADELINYSSEDLRTRVRELTDNKGCDVVFDPVGGDAFTQSVRCIGWEGRLLVIGFASGDIPTLAANMNLVKNFSTVGVVFGEHSARYPDDTRARFGDLLTLMQRGKLTPAHPKTFALANGLEAIRGIAERRVVGKVVLTMD
jgi:NADPH2:quinone reductase